MAGGAIPHIEVTSLDGNDLGWSGGEIQDDAGEKSQAGKR